MWLRTGARAAIPVVLVTLVAAGCVQWAVEEEVTFRADGSGSARVSFAFNREGASLFGIRERMEQEIRRQVPPEVQVRTREDARWVYWDLTFEFRDAQDLQEKMEAVRDGRMGWRWTVRVTRSSRWLKAATSYAAEFSFMTAGDAATMVPYLVGWKHRVLMPGRLVGSNGEVLGWVRGVEGAGGPGFAGRGDVGGRAVPGRSCRTVGAAAGAGRGVGGVRGATARASALQTVRGAVRQGARFCTVCGEKLVP